MSNIFNDDHTAWLNVKMSEYEDKIYAMEDDIASFEQNESQIIDYLRDIHFSMPLGLALRRYMCNKYAEFDPQNDSYVFSFDNIKITVANYQRENYDITNDDIPEYSDVFLRIDKKYNSNSDGVSLTGFTKAEAKRMLKVTTACVRSKMFLIGFALHMDNDEMHKFLTDILAEQTYNYRNPDEIIAFYCQSHNAYNSYISYLSIKRRFGEIPKTAQADEPQKPEYTAFASNALKSKVNTVDELMEFLRSNQNEFFRLSQTAYGEFMKMYVKALDKTRIQMLSNDDYLNFTRMSTEEQRKTVVERIDRAISLQQVTNTEQLARKMLECIPRYTKEYERNGKTIVENDFINIYNGERGQKSKKVQTTTLPKEITMNLLMKDRLDDLIRKNKAVERKDLVFMRFYLLSLEIESKEEFTMQDYWIFIDECNDMLVRCGMSRLYPGNRFENLIMLSLLSSNPYEMFENIIEYSFMNEPKITD